MSGIDGVAGGDSSQAAASAEQAQQAAATAEAPAPAQTAGDESAASGAPPRSADALEGSRRFTADALRDRLASWGIGGGDATQQGGGATGTAGAPPAQGDPGQVQAPPQQNDPGKVEAPPQPEQAADPDANLKSRLKDDLKSSKDAEAFNSLPPEKQDAILNAACRSDKFKDAATDKEDRQAALDLVNMAAKHPDGGAKSVLDPKSIGPTMDLLKSNEYKNAPQELKDQVERTLGKDAGTASSLNCLLKTPSFREQSVDDQCAKLKGIAASDNPPIAALNEIFNNMSDVGKAACRARALEKLAQPGGIGHAQELLPSELASLPQSARDKLADLHTIDGYYYNTDTSNDARKAAVVETLKSLPPEEAGAVIETIDRSSEGDKKAFYSYLVHDPRATSSTFTSRTPRDQEGDDLNAIADNLPPHAAGAMFRGVTNAINDEMKDKSLLGAAISGFKVSGEMEVGKGKKIGAEWSPGPLIDAMGGNANNEYGKLLRGLGQHLQSRYFDRNSNPSTSVPNNQDQFKTGLQGQSSG